MQQLAHDYPTNDVPDDASPQARDDQYWIRFWQNYGEGDPPAHIQAAFDREQVRRLKGEN